MGRPLPFLTAILMLLALCFGHLPAAQGVLDTVQEFLADAVLPPEQEAALGERMAREIEAKMPLHADEKLQQHVADIGQRLVAAAKDPPEAFDFSFRVLDDPDPNAMALPGGHIYVTSGLLDLTGSDAELAFVLAHEIAHVTERHIAQRLATQYGIDMLAGAALGQDPGGLTKLAGTVLQQGFLLRYSREQELEADRVGLDILAGAGFEPQAARHVLHRIAEARDAPEPPAILSTHPATDERIEQLEERM